MPFLISLPIRTALASTKRRFSAVSRRPVPSQLLFLFQKRLKARKPWRLTLTLQPTLRRLTFFDSRRSSKTESLIQALFCPAFSCVPSQRSGRRGKDCPRRCQSLCRSSYHRELAGPCEPQLLVCRRLLSCHHALSVFSSRLFVSSADLIL